MQLQTFEHGNHDLEKACNWFRGTDEYQKWVCKGNWYRALADGFHTYLDDPISANMVKNEWREVGLAGMVEKGIELAKQYIETL